ncbi:NADH-quinone oxidoreductase subunit NuoG [Moraxella sp. VT-16-12]|uniref:NADH-quinone oxidoreductase subunit NuoG n=1 Tax=Moraxella sp. VT-16-12 TaxID=2014877 RepID=UPI000B802B65|nr:NADH-quinone oxidoreductase subunit NuoG [Moraxella sp. VT-16-12]TWV82019.1 NADH-quinone oxidoreductase subunit NuoG [Moraxella sp. VT-16-12]
MAVIHIDGKSVEVDGSDNLLQACLSLGIDIPYFCYHPALGSVGSCRQCAVKQYMSEDDYKAGRGRLVMSCMVAPTNDMYISVDDDEAKAFRKRIVEYLMTNHPHDCPTCEEGGHCHLQDMTYMSGHRQRRYRFTKRTHHNQDLGVFINHEMNRCIACYRCVRFYKDYAGGTDFGVYASNNRVYFGRDTEGQFDSEFSGNLTEVCPTGVFTDKTHSDRYNRKWDMQYAPSICHGCSTGCNISAGERYGELRRIENRYNHDVNGYFLCDKGRFGYGYVNRSDRPVEPLQNINGTFSPISADFALDGVANLLKGKKVIGIGSANASLESNFALKKLVGADNYSTGERAIEQDLVGLGVQILRHTDVQNVSLAQIETADAVFILGEDLTQTASRVALSVRQAAKNKARQMATALRTEHWLAEPVKRIGQEAYSPIYVAGVTNSKLDDIAKVSVVATPNDIARLGFMVGDIIKNFADKLSKINEDALAFFAKETKLVVDDETSMIALAYHIAYDLIMAERPLILSGTSLSSKAILQATGYIAQTLTAKRQQIAHVEREYIEVQNAKIRDEVKRQFLDIDKSAKTDGNHHTERNPADFEKELSLRLLKINTQYADKTGVYLAMPSANSVGLNLLGGRSVEEILTKDFDAVVVLEHDLSNLTPSQFEQITGKTLIVLDHQRYDWHDKADFVLSVGSFAESDGTLVSADGRAGRFFAAYDKKYYEPNSDIKDAWRWLHALDNALSTNTAKPTWCHLDDVLDVLVADCPELALVRDVAPQSEYRITGLKVAREPRRYSGRTVLRSPISIHEPMQPKDLDSGLTFSMEGYVGDKTHASLIPFAWSAGWNSPQAWNKLQDKVGGKLKGGDVGIRLFDHLPKNDHVFEKLMINASLSSSIADGRAVLVPIYNLFSSNALISRSPVVASQIKPAVWKISTDDAKKWLIKNGDKLTLSQHDMSVTLPVQVVDYLADGCIGYPVGQVLFDVNVPTTVKKADDDTPVFVPAYQKSLKKLAVTQRRTIFSPTTGFNNMPLGQSSHQEVGV